MSNHYTYIHRQADDGSVFYVGKGTRKAQSISDEHKAALRVGYKKHFGIKDANN